MMMWSSIEMKSKFLQNFKMIRLRKFLKNIRVSILYNKSLYLKQKIMVLGSMYLPEVC